jgi:hypothetical protein
VGSKLNAVGLSARNRIGSISLSQEHYIRELLERFNMDDANPLSTPLSPGSELSDIVPSLEEQAEMKSVPYLNAVGAQSAIWLRGFCV